MKICHVCKLEKPVSDFNKNRSRKDGLQARCRDCNSVILKDDYKKNTSRYIKKAHKNNTIYKRRNLEFIITHLNNNPCKDCGETNILVLEFDHLRDKSVGIAILIHRGANLKTLQHEVSKCDVVCANCHRIRTAHRSNWSKLDYM